MHFCSRTYHVFLSRLVRTTFLFVHDTNHLVSDKYCPIVAFQVVDHMLDLWAAGERDMLDDRNQYRLTNTGQGLQRVQVALRGCLLYTSPSSRD